MPNTKNLEAIIKLALEQHEQYLSKLDNVQGMGIVAIDETDDFRIVEEKELGNKEPKIKHKSKQNKKVGQLALAVYVTKKIIENQLTEKQMIPKTLDVMVNGKLHCVNTKVVELEEMSFEAEDIGTDEL